jgi:hypothetical protein
LAYLGYSTNAIGEVTQIQFGAPRWIAITDSRCNINNHGQAQEASKASQQKKTR